MYQFAAAVPYQKHAEIHAYGITALFFKYKESDFLSSETLQLLSISAVIPK